VAGWKRRNILQQKEHIEVGANIKWAGTRIKGYRK